ncbi:MAG: threonylcarbamoyl-AMP synthase [Candidatus Saccharibacteria bacterium]|nr:threonylcarbamoyl-AMP synthase [Candidatus Saccharibacteria bacterium]
MRYVSSEQINGAEQALNRGDILATPTETVYDLVVKADNTSAIRKLLELKNRQISNRSSLTIMLADVDEIKNFAIVNHKTINLARHYFPGELTLILPKRRAFKHPYFDHFDEVSIRIPNHRYLLKLIRAAGPLLATNASLSGKAPCRSSKEVSAQFPTVDTAVEGISGGNLPSTIIDWTEEEPIPIRQGGLLIVRYA